MELVRNKQSPPHFIGKEGELVVKKGVLRPPTPPTLRTLLVLSKEKNRTLGMLAKILVSHGFKNIKTQLYESYLGVRGSV